MKIIGADEANKILTLNGGRETLLSSQLKQLQPGQGLVVTRADWKPRYSPSRIARQIEKKYNWKFRTGRMPDGTGWLLQRMS